MVLLWVVVVVTPGAGGSEALPRVAVKTSLSLLQPIEMLTFFGACFVALTSERCYRLLLSNRLSTLSHVNVILVTILFRKEIFENIQQRIHTSSKFLLFNCL